MGNKFHTMDLNLGEGLKKNVPETGKKPDLKELDTGVSIKGFEVETTPINQSAPSALSNLISDAREQFSSTVIKGKEDKSSWEKFDLGKKPSTYRGIPGTNDLVARKGDKPVYKLLPAKKGDKGKVETLPYRTPEQQAKIDAHPGFYKKREPNWEVTPDNQLIKSKFKLSPTAAKEIISSKGGNKKASLLKAAALGVAGAAGIGLGIAGKAKYDELKHPRDEDGKFASKGMDTIEKGSDSHPGFQKVAEQIGEKYGGGEKGKRIGAAILAKKTREASPEAKAKNPNLMKVKCSDRGSSKFKLGESIKCSTNFAKKVKTKGDSSSDFRDAFRAAREQDASPASPPTSPPTSPPVSVATPPSDRGTVSGYFRKLNDASSLQKGVGGRGSAKFSMGNKIECKGAEIEEKGVGSAVMTAVRNVSRDVARGKGGRELLKSVGKQGRALGKRAKAAIDAPRGERPSPTVAQRLHTMDDPTDQHSHPGGSQTKLLLNQLNKGKKTDQYNKLQKLTEPGWDFEKARRKQEFADKHTLSGNFAAGTKKIKEEASKHSGKLLAGATGVAVGGGLGVAGKAKYDESKHRRDESGKFANKGVSKHLIHAGIGAALGSAAGAVADKENRARGAAVGALGGAAAGGIGGALTHEIVKDTGIKAVKRDLRKSKALEQKYLETGVSSVANDFKMLNPFRNKKLDAEREAVGKKLEGSLSELKKEASDAKQSGIGKAKLYKKLSNVGGKVGAGVGGVALGTAGGYASSKYDESKHRRDENGKFASKGASSHLAKRRADPNPFAEERGLKVPVDEKGNYSPSPKPEPKPKPGGGSGREIDYDSVG